MCHEKPPKAKQNASTKVTTVVQTTRDGGGLDVGQQEV